MVRLALCVLVCSHLCSMWPSPFCLGALSGADGSGIAPLPAIVCTALRRVCACVGGLAKKKTEPTKPTTEPTRAQRAPSPLLGDIP